MTAGGWFFLAASWAVLLGVFAFALRRTLKGRRTDGAPQNEDRSPDRPGGR
jgi:hypothetical protein